MRLLQDVIRKLSMDPKDSFGTNDANSARGTIFTQTAWQSKVFWRDAEGSSTAAETPQCTRRGCPAQYFSRKVFLRILPVPPLGRLSTNSTDLGILNLAR